MRKISKKQTSVKRTGRRKVSDEKIVKIYKTWRAAKLPVKDIIENSGLHSATFYSYMRYATSKLKHLIK